MAERALATVAAERGLVGGPFGSSLVSKDYVDAGVPVIRGNNMLRPYVSGEFVHVTPDKVSKDLARNIASPGDLVFTQRGTLGQVSIVPNDPWREYVISQSQMRLRVDETKADPHFVYYACRRPAFLKQIADNAIATGVPHINLGILGRLTIPDLSVDQQRATAEVLSALDNKIAANDRVILKTVDLLDSLYRLALSMNKNSSAKLFDVFEVDFGEAFKGEFFTEPGNGRPLIRIRDLKTFRPQTWTSESLANEVMVEPGDVVVGMDAEFRATVWLGEPGLLNQRVCRVRGKHAGAAFVVLALRRPLSVIENEKSGTTVIHLNKSDLERAIIDIPTSVLLERLESKCEPLLRSRVSLALENRLLAQTRDELLPLLMSGRVRVKDAEKVVEEVT